MTIESDLNRIANAIEAIAATLTVVRGENLTPAPAVAPTPTPVVVAPVVSAVPVPVMAPPVSAMPAAPFPTVAAVAAPAATTIQTVTLPTPTATTTTVSPSAAAPAVFASKEEMTQFVIAQYRALGAEKGAGIQGVLTGMGYANINDVDPARWGDLKSGIEALAK